MSKDSFIFYRDWLDGLKGLDPAMRLELLGAILKYGLDGEETELSSTSRIVFGFIKPQLDRAANKYEQICERNRENGRKGGAPKGNQNARKKTTGNNPINPNNPDGCLLTQINPKQPKQPYNDNDNDNDNDNEIIKKDKNKFLSQKKESRFIPPTVEEVAEYCRTRNNGIDAETFVCFYASKGWMIGKNKMKDWKKAVITWEKKQINEHLNTRQNGNLTNEDRRKLERVKRDEDAVALINHLLATNEQAVDTATGERI